ncbi:MAG TPA: hypothetical protein VKB56_14070 [Terriglobales bacterium]|nr:hypothetical protein [Terriglobales bacterium]
MAAAIGVLAGQIRKSKLAAAFLDGVNVAAVALMTEIAVVFGRAALVDAPTWGIGLLSAVFLIRVPRQCDVAYRCRRGDRNPAAWITVTITRRSGRR